MKRRTPESSDYWEILLRRRWWIVVPAMVVTAATCLVVWRMPKVYRSETLILVDPQKIPSDFVRSTISSDITERLQTISQEILSRTRLQTIIDQLGLYHDLHQRLLPEDIIEQMRKDITVETILSPGPREHAVVGAFKISYEGRDPALVQQVTREIASLFIQENLGDRERGVVNTSDFISQELEKAAAVLQTQEERMKEFKARNMGNLPEQQTANLQLLGQLQTMLQAETEALARAQQQKTYLESLLNALTAGKGPAPPAQQAELEAKRAELAAAEQKYKPSHPDVIRLKGEVAALEKQTRNAPKIEPGISTSNQELKGQIASLEQEINLRSQEQKDTESKIRTLEHRLEVLPAVEEQLAAVNRDYQVSKDNYQSLLAKKNASGIAVDLERRAQGERFRIIDPASYPSKPYKPNVLQYDAMGALGGIVLGCGLALVMEFKDSSLHNAKDVTHYLSLPVLASLPLTAGGKRTWQRRTEKWQRMRLSQ